MALAAWAMRRTSPWPRCAAELFKAKCAGVYLNSGSAHGNPAKPEQLEFNVKLDPAAYAAMFDLPCPLLWFRCWHTTEQRQGGADGGSTFRMPKRIGGLSAGLSNFFAYLFEKSADPEVAARDERRCRPAMRGRGS